MYYMNLHTQLGLLAQLKKKKTLVPMSIGFLLLKYKNEL